LEGLRGALEIAIDRRRQVYLLLHLLDRLDRLADRVTLRQVERQRHPRELALVVDRERFGFGGDVRKGADGELHPVWRRDEDLRQRARVVLELRQDLEDDL